MEKITPLSKYRKYPAEVIALTDWLHDQERVDEAHAVLTAYDMGKLAVIKSIKLRE